MHTLLDQMDDFNPIAVHIGGRSITHSSPPFVIAEAGVNHDGQLSQAKKLVDVAKDAGADAVKFQVFQANTLAAADAEAASYQKRKDRSLSQRQLLSKLELSIDAFKELSSYCRSSDIIFLATPFTQADLQTVLDLSAPAIKVASTDLNNLPFLEAVCQSGRPVLLSSGASELVEIDRAISLFDQNNACDRLVLLHCISSYPTPVDEASLSTLNLLRHRYHVWVGFSDHTESIETGGVAVAAGARVLEKHFTLDRKLEGPDHAFSLTPTMLSEYIDFARRAHRMMGEPRRGVTPSEQEVRKTARKSLVAACAIAKDEVITKKSLAIKRPAGGIEPAQYDEVLGKKATRDIPADTRLDWSMLR